MSFTRIHKSGAMHRNDGCDSPVQVEMAYNAEINSNASACTYLCTLIGQAWYLTRSQSGSINTVFDRQSEVRFSPQELEAPATEQQSRRIFLRSKKWPQLPSLFKYGECRYFLLAPRYLSPARSPSQTLLLKRHKFFPFYFLSFFRISSVPHNGKINTTSISLGTKNEIVNQAAVPASSDLDWQAFCRNLIDNLSARDALAAITWNPCSRLFVFYYKQR